jgi:predicted Zn-dependent protease
VHRIAQDFDLWRDGAKHLYDAGKYADAAANGRELIQAHPDQVYLHFNVARCDARAGRAADSIAALRSALQAWTAFATWRRITATSTPSATIRHSRS